MKMCLGVAFVADCLLAKGCFPVYWKSASIKVHILHNITKCSNRSRNAYSEGHNRVFSVSKYYFTMTLSQHRFYSSPFK